jgi:hypothetical protein
MDELMPPVGSVEKKAEFIRLLLSFLLRWIISFFPVQIPGKKIRLPTANNFATGS